MNIAGSLLCCVIITCMVMSTEGSCNPKNCAIPIPRSISQQDFKDKILDKDLYHYYVADPSMLFGLPFNAKLKFRDVSDYGEEEYAITLVGRCETDFSSENCTDKRTFNLSPKPKQKRDQFVVVNDVSNGTQYYFSSNLDKYVILLGCLEVSSNKKCCIGDYYVIVFAYEDVPNELPWCSIEEDLKSKLYLSLTSPGFKFTRTRIACPNEV